MNKTRQLRLAKDAMDRDWGDPELDLNAVAAHAGYSRYHFIRAFKETYGETPGQYLTHRRIERAEDLLRTADLSVTEICTLVGFSSLGTFSARFKAWTGLTPSEYRTRHVGRGAALIPGCYAMLWAGGFRGGQGRAERDAGTAERDAGDAGYGAEKTDHGAEKADHGAVEADHGVGEADHGAGEAEHGAGGREVCRGENGPQF